MKLIKNILLCIIAGSLSLTAITSCSDFLNEELTTKRNTDYFKTNEGLEALMTGIYYDLRFHFAFEWAYTTTNYGTDEFIVGGDRSNSMWNDYGSSLNSDIATVNVNTTRAFDIWDNMYIGIASANTILSNIDNYTGSMKNEMLGTAHFIRGFNYFKLVCQYGGVPLKLEPSTSVDLEYSRATAKEVIDQSLADLLEAYNNLPLTESAEGKLTKTAAAHFLAKAYLWRASELNNSWNSDTKSADLDNVIKYAQEVIDACPLAPNYRDLWAYTQPDDANEKLSEIVLAAQFTFDPATRGSRGNQMHLHFLSIYNNLPGMARDISGGREYQRLRTSYYTYNIYNHLDDSRLWKSFRTKFNWTRASAAIDNGSGTVYNPGDVGVMYILNNPGDNRFPAIQNTEFSGNLDAGKLVPTVFAIYPAGSDRSTNPMEDDAYQNRFAPLSKYVDGSRETVALEAGNRDGILARSAEDYFFIAEAYIRKGDYAAAWNYIKPIRERAQWKAGEDRADYIDGGAAWKAGAAGWGIYTFAEGKGTFCNRNSYYESNNLPLGSLNTQASNLIDAAINISTLAGLPAEDRAVCEKLGYTNPYDIAMCFLLNEKTREFCGEFLRWEDLARTRTLYDRARAFNKGAAPNIQDNKNYLRPIPQTYLDIIQRDGRALTPDEKRAEQNPGY